MSETKYIDLNAENLQEDDASRADKIENEHIDKQQESDEATEKRATVSENVHKAIIGVLFGLGVCFSWVASTQFSQSTYSETFYGPFFITWFLTLWMMVCYPAYILGSFIMFPTKRKAGIRKMYNEDQKLYGEKGLTWLSAFKLTGPFLLMWAGTNYVYLRALGSTSATVVTTLFVTNTAFTLSVLLSIGGTVLISYAEGFQKGGTRIDGVLLALLAACGAALYKSEVVDFFFRGMTFEGLKLAGACLIFVGFVIMVLPTSCQEKLACCCFRQKKDKEGLERSVEEEEESLKANTDRGETVNTTV
ncbi:Solute carrier family 35 member F4 [Holothuria leucospilota]|uniref:Solute carrier family 35 member F4 n=1 Tax=Holothuria leucospilota TaxID=206669 RepID=A0A9Q0YCU6_HOLLE|nr:Solute carrier family 35 member F4 [Holothuria leucospilota]